jgi:hypothetical protein
MKKHRLLQGLDRLEGLARLGKSPILEQIGLIKVKPFQNSAKRTLREFPANDAKET